MTLPSSTLVLSAVFVAACGGAATPHGPNVTTTVVRRALAPAKPNKEAASPQMKVACKGDAERFTDGEVRLSFRESGLAISVAGGRERDVERCSIMIVSGKKVLPVTISCLEPKAKKPFEFAHRGLLSVGPGRIQTIGLNGDETSIAMKAGTRCVLTLGKKGAGLDSI